MRKLIFLVLLVLNVLWMPARASDFTTPIMPGLGGCIAMTNPSAFDLLLSPGAAFTSRSLSVDFYDFERWHLAELHESGAALAYVGKENAIALGVSQFGEPGLYREISFRTSLYKRAGRFSLALSGTYSAIEFGEYYAGVSSVSIGCGAAYRRRTTIISMNLEDIPVRRTSGISRRQNPKLAWYLETWPRRIYALTGRVTVEKGRRIQFGFGQIINLPRQSRLFWGIANRPLIYGGGLEICAYKAFITCTASYHPVLGLSRMITLSFRGGGTRPGK